MPHEADEGLIVLREHLGQQTSIVTPALLDQCYGVLRNFMYEKDQELALDQIRRLVEAESTRLAAAAEAP